jgi:predicted naringenin-chalcone synthase
MDDSSGSRIIMHDFLSLLIPESEDKMAWKIGDNGFEMWLSAYIPQILDQHIMSVMDEFKNKTGIRKEEIDIWAIHPGGRSILDKLGKTLGLAGNDLSISYDVLRDYGNMSSATIMFVLARILENNAAGRIFAAAFGPGLTVETGHFEKV